MERLTLHCPVLSYIGTLASAPSFMLVDVGCSGGIAKAWRQFGSRLRALAIDPDAAEIDALRRQESSPGVEYLAAFAALADDHPFALRQAGRSGIGRTPWNRLSVARSLEATARRAAAAPAASAPAAPSTDARGHEPAP